MTVNEARKKAKQIYWQVAVDVDPPRDRKMSRADPTTKDFAKQVLVDYAEKREKTAGADRAML